MDDVIEINKQTILLGEKKIILLPMPQLYDSTPLSMPVHVLRSKKSGPILCLSAAIHGDELNGIEIIRRILKHSALKQMKGTLIAIPIVNMYGFLYQDRYLMDRRDLNRVFPGSEKGSLASRLAHLISTEIINKVTHCIDLHTGSLHRTNLPQIRISSNCNDEMLAMAQAFHPPVILKTKLLDGSLRQYTANRNIPTLLYEAGESLRFDEYSIRTGVKGILNVMEFLGMIKKRAIKTKNNQLNSNIAQASYWVRASHSGIFQPKKLIGQQVKKGELLATIGNPTTIDEQALYSPISGVIIGKNILPIIHEGAALFHIASFQSIDLAKEHIENLQESYDEQIQG